MDEWCLVCHKVTHFEMVPGTTRVNGEKRTVSTLGYCSECHVVIFCEAPIPHEELKAKRERAELLEGFD